MHLPQAIFTKPATYLAICILMFIYKKALLINSKDKKLDHIAFNYIFALVLINKF